MNKPLTGLQVLILWRLLFRGEGYLADFKPKLETKDRAALKAAGLIQEEKKRREVPGKRAGSPTFISVTERGWQWASEHLDAEISLQTNATGPVLHSVLSRLKCHLGNSGLSLAEFMTDGSKQPQSDLSVAPNGQDVRSRVRSAYFDLSGHQANRRVRLADLRGKLADVPRIDLDAALVEMERAKALVLYPLENPQEIRAEDREAVLENSAGFPRHIVYME